MKPCTIRLINSALGFATFNPNEYTKLHFKLYINEIGIKFETFYTQNCIPSCV